MVFGYGDMINASRPVYDEYPAMSIHDRAAQFSPFAALTGFEDAVAESARFTESRRELTEDEQTQLSIKLVKLEESLPYSDELNITYFLPDKRKKGGSYEHIAGSVRIIDHYCRELVMTDGLRIPIDDLVDITIEDQKNRNDL